MNCALLPKLVLEYILKKLQGDFCRECAVGVQNEERWLI